MPPQSGLAARCITPPSLSCLLRGRTMAFLQYIRPSHNNWVNVSRLASYRRVNVSSLRSYASPSAPFNREHTVPNYSKPSRINGRKESRADQGKNSALFMNIVQWTGRFHCVEVQASTYFRGSNIMHIHLTDISSLQQDIYPLQGHLFTNLLCRS